MKIERVTTEEFATVKRENTLRIPRPSELTLAVRALEPGEALKVDCKWNHPSNNCGGSTQQHLQANRHGYKIRTSCKDGKLYIQKRISD